jgi:hypothetical protein
MEHRYRRLALKRPDLDVAVLVTEAASDLASSNSVFNTRRAASYRHPAQFAPCRMTPVREAGEEWRRLAVSGGILISTGGRDPGQLASRLHGRLAERFGQAHVVMDADTIR